MPRTRSSDAFLNTPSRSSSRSIKPSEKTSTSAKKNREQPEGISNGTGVPVYKYDTSAQKYVLLKNGKKGREEAVMGATMHEVREEEEAAEEVLADKDHSGKESLTSEDPPKEETEESQEQQEGIQQEEQSNFETKSFSSAALTWGLLLAAVFFVCSLLALVATGRVQPNDLRLWSAAGADSGIVTVVSEGGKVAKGPAWPDAGFYQTHLDLSRKNVNKLPESPKKQFQQVRQQNKERKEEGPSTAATNKGVQQRSEQQREGIAAREKYVARPLSDADILDQMAIGAQVAQEAGQAHLAAQKSWQKAMARHGASGSRGQAEPRPQQQQQQWRKDRPRRGRGNMPKRPHPPTMPPPHVVAANQRMHEQFQRERAIRFTEL